MRGDGERRDRVGQRSFTLQFNFPVGDRPTIDRRQYIALCGSGLTLTTAGCIGGGGDSSDGGGLYEGDEFTCADVGTASRTQYDVAGTGLLCRFEYPDVFDRANTRGSPISRLEFLKRFGGDEPYTEDTLSLTVTQSDTGLEEAEVNTDGEGITEVAFGERTAYVRSFFQDREVTSGPNKAQYEANTPHEIDGTVRYYSLLLVLSINLQVTEGNRDAPEACATTLEETCRAIAESVTPNPETAFDEVREG